MDVSYFVNQLPEDSDLRTIVATMGSTVARFKQEAASIKADRRYSAQGHAEQIKAAAEKGPLAFFKEMRKQQAQERASLERRKGAIQLKPVDQKDLWAELRARELRDFMRTIPLPDRMRLAIADPEFARAIIHAPEPLTGIEGDFRDRIIQAELEREHGAGEIQAISEEAAALDVTDKALEVTYAALLIEAGMKPEAVSNAAAA